MGIPIITHGVSLFRTCSVSWFILYRVAELETTDACCGDAVVFLWSIMPAGKTLEPIFGSGRPDVTGIV